METGIQIEKIEYEDEILFIGKLNDDKVISVYINSYSGKLVAKIGTSITLPTNFEAVKQVLLVMNKTIETAEKYLNEKLEEIL